MFRRESTLLAISTVAFLAPSLFASDQSPCGSGYGQLSTGYLGFTVRSSDFPSGSAFREALLDVAYDWSHTRSKVNYDVAFVSDNHEPGPDNLASEVYFVDIQYPPALTMTWMGLSSCTIIESDVILLDTHPWTASTDPDDIEAYGGDDPPLRTVLFHEFGHAQGLGHTSTVYSVMGEDGNHLHLNDGIVTAYPGEDAVSKSVAKYGNVNGTYEDLGLAHWERTGQYGQYSLHGRTRVLAGPGASVLEIDFPDMQFEVGLGEKVRVETTVENFGKGSHDVRIGYYVSANDNLSTQDRFLGSHVKYVTPNVPTTIESPLLTIPADLASQTDYWIGAIIDDNQQLAEVDEWNNRTSMRIRTRATPENLVAAAIGGPSEAKAGTAVYVSSTIVNSGDGYVPHCTYEIRLSTNNLITQSDTLVASFEDADIAFHIDQVTIPANLAAGDYYWGLRVLQSNEEVVTTDNKLAGNKIKVTKGKPDLVAVDIDGPNSTHVNDHVAVQCEIANEGGLALGPYNFKIYLSLDNDIEPTDYLVKSVNTFTLGDKTVQVTIPALPATGYYRIGMIVTPASGETDTSDNVFLGGVVNITSIDGGGTDLTPN